MAYDLDENGASNGRVFYDVNDQTAPGAADGLKVDLAGNLFATGPGGVWVLSWDGVHLGTIMPGEVVANVAWGRQRTDPLHDGEHRRLRIRLATGGTVAGKPTVVMETSHGSFTMELFQDRAPVSVRNFLQYAYAGFYADTVFHRVIDDFMIQGGGFRADLSRKFAREPILNEADNGISNTRGTVAMPAPTP